MTLRVAFAADDADHPESAAIADWLRGLADVDPVPVAVRDLSTAEADAVWIHGVEPVALESLGPEAADLLTLGRVLLTGGAAVLPAAAGLEPVSPNDVDRLRWHAAAETPSPDPAASTGDPPVRGHASFRGHPLLQGLGDAVDTWQPTEGEPFTRVSYIRPQWPRHARVIAVERSALLLDAGRATIWEHDGRQGPVLSIGCYLPLHAAGQRVRPRVERLARNALLRVAGRLPGEPAHGHWRLVNPGAAEDRTLSLAELPLLEEPLGAPDFRLRATGRAGDDRSFTVAGRRAFAVGGEARGVDEIWAHPLRLAAGIRLRGAVAEQATVTPLGLERRLRVDDGAVLERVVIPAEAPIALLEWHSASRSVELDLEWDCDLRVTWPYPASATGTLRWRVTGRGVVVADGSQNRAVFVLSRAPDSLTAEDVSGAASRVRIRARFRLHPRNGIRLGVAGGAGEAMISRALRAADRTVAAVRSREAAAERLLTDRLVLEAPDPTAVQALDWAKVRLVSYVAESPGVGRSLVAGYGPSGAGPGEDGRPRYAWYFGRDTVWSALACLAIGETGAAHDALMFLGRHQGPSGQVAHECTTSGSIHYHGADATPAYLLLAARYLAWTGDVATVQAEWTRVLRAYEHCLSLDTDGDGMIESTGAGHARVEHGRPGGGGVTFHDAGLWAAALRELALAAESIGEKGSAVEMRVAAERAGEALERLLRIPEGYAHEVQPGEGRGGARGGDETWTATHAVPLLLGAVGPDAMEGWLDAIAGQAFTTPWGVRLLPATHPEYDPCAYHGGTVRPPFTGLVSWAEYAAGRAEAAFGHWRSNLEEAFRHQRGAWSEALRGDDGRPAGASPDQAWGAAMTVLPLVHGLLGAEPDATRGRLVLRPSPPRTWRSFAVRNLPIGDAAVTLEYRCSGGTHRFRVRQERGAHPIILVLEPTLPARRLRAARVDGVVAELDPELRGERLVVPLQLALDHERVVELDVEGEPAG